MQKIKVLHISQSSGGVKSYIMNIVSNSDTELYSHYLITSDKQFLEDFKEYGKSFFVAMKREVDLIYDLSNLYQIIKIIKNIKPDVLHLHSAKGGAFGRIASRITNVPCIFTPNAFSYLSFNGIKKKLYIGIEKFLKNYTDCLLAVSNSEKERAINQIGYNSEKVITVANAIKLQKKKKLSYDLKNTIGMIGRITHQKNPILFVKLANFLNKNGFSNFQYLLLGAGLDDHLREDVQNKILECDLETKVSILSWREESYIYNFFDKLDIFVLTSEYEGLPFSLLEAMEFGLPCIVTNVDGNRDTITDGHDGFIVNNEEELFNKTKELLNNSLLRKKIGINAIDTIENKHNIVKSVKSIEQVYKKVIK